MVDYTNTTVSGYNTSPPADDGSVTEANRTTWDKVKTKLADPLKTAVSSLNTNIAESIASIPTLVGDQSMWVNWSEMTPGSSVTTTSGSTTIKHTTLTDSATTDQQHFVLALPKKWNAGEVTAKIYFVQHLVGTGDVVITLSALSVSSAGSINSFYSTSTDATIVLPGTQYDIFVSDDIAVTPANTPADDDLILFFVTRDYADAGDTYADTIGLLGLKLTYNATAVTDD